MPDILLVEDDRELSDMIVEILEDEGYPVRVANNGNQALQAVSSRPPRLMLLDLLMPEVDGYDVLRALQAKSLPDMAVVVFTANHIDHSELLKLGAVSVLRKPFMIDELLATVTHYLSNAT